MAERGRPLDTILEIDRELCSVFEEAFQLDRRAHLRLASSNSQKIREVNTILDSLPSLAFLKDADFCYVSVNRTFCDVFGLPAEKIISKTDFDRIPYNCRSCRQRTQVHTLAGGYCLRASSLGVPPPTY